LNNKTGEHYKKMSKIISWLDIPAKSDFSIYNIPFGVFKSAKRSPRMATRLGNYIIDLQKLFEHDYLNGIGLSLSDYHVFRQETLNDFISLGKNKIRNIRNRIIELFNKDNYELQGAFHHNRDIILDIKEVELLKPFNPSDYTDFYSSIEHASNVGKMFRDKENPLLPNWKHLPVGYHGRVSSIVGSGIGIHRPKGQIFDVNTGKPVFSASKKLDFELEMAFVTTGKTKLGDSVAISKAEDYILGMVLFNDLSARDIQQWEYVPLGPFLGKNFASVMSNWLVLLDALEPFRVDSPKQEPNVLPYLQFSGKGNYDIRLEVYIKTAKSKESLICDSNTKYLYWNIFQQLAHQTVNGCNLNNAGLYASGTISGPDESSFGSMLELSWNGTKAIKISAGERYFLEDGDIVIMKAYAENATYRVGFGDCIVKILPAK